MTGIKANFGLYIHFPWCVKKCPYCDFNSHVLHENIPEEAYIDALIADIHNQKHLFEHRTLTSIFMGGGTPSLFSPNAIARLLEAIQAVIPIDDCEITLEANPGTIDQDHLPGYRAAGINRLSLGVQTFNDAALTRIGRIHNADNSYTALETAVKIFQRINIDIMFGLPEQTIDEALEDLAIASRFPIEHLSWYQLTIEAETHFAKKPPLLPHPESIEDMYLQGIDLLEKSAFKHYEISAHTRGRPSLHNHNYWSYGDYLGIGAGAHSKWTTQEGILRWSLWRSPKKYLNASAQTRTEWTSMIAPEDRIFEYFLNRSRMHGSVTWEDIAQSTQLPLESLMTWKDSAYIHLKDFILLDNEGVKFLPDCMLFNRLFMEKMLIV